MRAQDYTAKSCINVKLNKQILTLAVTKSNSSGKFNWKNQDSIQYLTTALFQIVINTTHMLHVDVLIHIEQ